MTPPLIHRLADALRTARGTLHWYAVENNDDGDREQVDAIDLLLIEYDASNPEGSPSCTEPWCCF